MKYIQIDIEMDKEAMEPFISALSNEGITDMAIEDPADIEEIMEKKEEFHWDYIDPEVLSLREKRPKVTLYREDGTEGMEMVEKIEGLIVRLKEEMTGGAFGEIGAPYVEMKVALRDEDEWKDNWKEYFRPAKISDRIVVKPTWEEYERQADELVIEIDPGMAFGTGTHETTSLCVKLMEKYMKPGDKVLDVGCGSGILTIAGGLLGASEILGIDIDPVAVEISAENIEKNRLSQKARVMVGDLTKGIDFRANLVVGNLMADLVMMLSEDVVKHLLEGGYYISSGILDEKLEQVKSHMESLGLKVVEVKQDGMWCAVVARV